MALLSASFPTWDKDNPSNQSFLLLIGIQETLGSFIAMTQNKNEFKNKDF